VVTEVLLPAWICPSEIWEITAPAADEVFAGATVVGACGCPSEIWEMTAPLAEAVVFGAWG
jgi:hypothetical protein